MNPLQHVKPAVRQIGAYTLAARQAPVKVNQNENPYDLPEALKRRVVEQAMARSWSRYPDFDPQELLEKLAAFAGWRADGVLVADLPYYTTEYVDIPLNEEARAALRPGRNALSVHCKRVAFGGFCDAGLYDLAEPESSGTGSRR